MSINIEALFQHLMEDPDIIPPDGENKEDIAMAMATQREKQSNNNIKALNMAVDYSSVEKLLAFTKAEEGLETPPITNAQMGTYATHLDRLQKQNERITSGMDLEEPQLKQREAAQQFIEDVLSNVSAEDLKRFELDQLSSLWKEQEEQLTPKGTAADPSREQLLETIQRLQGGTPPKPASRTPRTPAGTPKPTGTPKRTRTPKPTGTPTPTGTPKTIAETLEGWPTQTPSATPPASSATPPEPVETASKTSWGSAQEASANFDVEDFILDKNHLVEALRGDSEDTHTAAKEFSEKWANHKDFIQNTFAVDLDDVNANIAEIDEVQETPGWQGDASHVNAHNAAVADLKENLPFEDSEADAFMRREVADKLAAATPAATPAAAPTPATPSALWRAHNIPQPVKNIISRLERGESTEMGEFGEPKGFTSEDQEKKKAAYDKALAGAPDDWLQDHKAKVTAGAKLPSSPPSPTAAAPPDDPTGDTAEPTAENLEGEQEVAPTQEELDAFTEDESGEDAQGHPKGSIFHSGSDAYPASKESTAYDTLHANHDPQDLRDALAWAKDGNYQIDGEDFTEDKLRNPTSGNLNATNVGDMVGAYRKTLDESAPGTGGTPRQVVEPTPMETYGETLDNLLERVKTGHNKVATNKTNPSQFNAMNKLREKWDELGLEEKVGQGDISERDYYEKMGKFLGDNAAQFNEQFADSRVHITPTKLKPPTAAEQDLAAARRELAAREAGEVKETGQPEEQQWVAPTGPTSRAAAESQARREASEKSEAARLAARSPNVQALTEAARQREAEAGRAGEQETEPESGESPPPIEEKEPEVEAAAEGQEGTAVDPIDNPATEKNLQSFLDMTVGLKGGLREPLRNSVEAGIKRQLTETPEALRETGDGNFGEIREMAESNNFMPELEPDTSGAHPGPYEHVPMTHKGEPLSTEAQKALKTYLDITMSQNAHTQNQYLPHAKQLFEDGIVARQQLSSMGIDDLSDIQSNRTGKTPGVITQWDTGHYRRKWNRGMQLKDPEFSEQALTRRPDDLERFSGEKEGAKGHFFDRLKGRFRATAPMHKPTEEPPPIEEVQPADTEPEVEAARKQEAEAGERKDMEGVHRKVVGTPKEGDTHAFDGQGYRIDPITGEELAHPDVHTIRSGFGPLDQELWEERQTPSSDRSHNRPLDGSPRAGMPFDTPITEKEAKLLALSIPTKDDMSPEDRQAILDQHHKTYNPNADLPRVDGMHSGVRRADDGTIEEPAAGDKESPPPIAEVQPTEATPDDTVDPEGHPIDAVTREFLTSRGGVNQLGKLSRAHDEDSDALYEKLADAEDQEGELFENQQDYARHHITMKNRFMELNKYLKDNPEATSVPNDKWDSVFGENGHFALNQDDDGKLSLGQHPRHAEMSANLHSGADESLQRKEDATEQPDAETEEPEATVVQPEVQPEDKPITITPEEEGDTGGRSPYYQSPYTQRDPAATEGQTEVQPEGQTDEDVLTKKKEELRAHGSTEEWLNSPDTTAKDIHSEHKKMINGRNTKAIKAKESGIPTIDEVFNAMVKESGKTGDDEVKYREMLKEKHQFNNVSDVIKDFKTMKAKNAANKHEQARGVASADVLGMGELKEDVKKRTATDRLRDVMKKAYDNKVYVENGGSPLLNSNELSKLKTLLENAIDVGDLPRSEVDDIHQELLDKGDKFYDDDHKAEVDADNDKADVDHYDFLDYATGMTDAHLARRGHDIEHSKAHEMHHHDRNEDGTLGERTGSSHHQIQDDGSVRLIDGKGRPESLDEAKEGIGEVKHPPKLLGLSEDGKAEQQDHFDLMKDSQKRLLSDEEMDRFKELEGNNPDLASPKYKGQLLGADRDTVSGKDGGKAMDAMGIAAEDQDEAAANSCRPGPDDIAPDATKGWNPDTHRWNDKDRLEEIRSGFGLGEGSFHPNGIHAGTENAHLDHDENGVPQAALVTATGVHKVDLSNGGSKGMTTGADGHVGISHVMGEHLKDHSGGKVGAKTMGNIGFGHSPKHSPHLQGFKPLGVGPRVRTPREGEEKPGGYWGEQKARIANDPLVRGVKAGVGYISRLGKRAKQIQGSKPSATALGRQTDTRDTSGSALRNFLNFAGKGVKEAALTVGDGGGVLGMAAGGAVRSTDAYRDKKTREAKERLRKKDIAAQKITDSINRVTEEDEKKG